MSESLAKMSLKPFALESHVDEALQLFQVSTLDAAMSGSLSDKYSSSRHCWLSLCCGFCMSLLWFSVFSS